MPTSQAGGTCFVTPALRVRRNVVLPIGDDQPRHAVRWWSRFQIDSGVPLRDDTQPLTIAVL